MRALDLDGLEASGVGEGAEFVRRELELGHDLLEGDRLALAEEELQVAASLLDVLTADFSLGGFGVDVEHAELLDTSLKLVVLDLVAPARVELLEDEVTHQHLTAGDVDLETQEHAGAERRLVIRRNEGDFPDEGKIALNGLVKGSEIKTRHELPLGRVVA